MVHPLCSMLFFFSTFNGQIAHHESILIVAIFVFPLTSREQGPKDWERFGGIKPFKNDDHGVNMRAKCMENLNIIPTENAATEPPHKKSLSGQQLQGFEQGSFKLRLPACSVAEEDG